MTVCAHARDAKLHLAIRDNGVGGAEPAKGSGLAGLRDRIEAFGGTMDICSDAGRKQSRAQRQLVLRWNLKRCHVFEEQPLTKGEMTDETEIRSRPMHAAASSDAKQ